MPKKSISSNTSKAAKIKAQIQKLQAELKALTTGKAAKPGKRTMSAEAREKIAAAQRRRWAKTKTALKPAKATKSAKAGKRTMSPEAREKIAATQRRRWAKVKR